MDHEWIGIAAFAAAILSSVVHVRFGSAIDVRLVDHLRDEHPDGWRAAGGPIVVHDEHEPMRRGFERRMISRLALHRWLRARGKDAGGCETCARSRRELTTCFWSWVGSTFLLLAIYEIWGP